MEKQAKDKRKLLLVLPLLALPFLALGFYALGGGKGTTTANTVVTKGINPDLPNASFKQVEPTDKLGYYQQAERDSAGKGGGEIASLAGKLGFNAQEDDPQEKAISDRLDALNREINKPEPVTPAKTVAQVPSSPGMRSDVDRLEGLMKSMQDKKEEDPEMAQLNTMLDKIISIQNPTAVIPQVATTTLKNDSLFRAIPAFITDDQKAVQGATIRLQLRDSVRIGGIFLPKGHQLFGTCRITNQRLLLDIKNVRLGTSIIPVDLSVYSLDGMAGIYAPDAVLTEAVITGSDNALRNIDILGTGQSVGMQAAGIGIETAQNLFSKRIKKIRVKLKAGQAVLLRNNKPQQSN